MYQVQQSTTNFPLLFFMVNSTDHVSAVTGLTPTVTLSKNGGSFASPSGSVTEIANGWYQVAGNATDTNTLGPLVLHATGTGADPFDAIFPVVAFNPRDSVRMGMTALPNAAAEAAGGLYTRGSGAGQINQNANGQVDARAVAISSGAITSGAFAAGAIDASAIATDAIGSAELAATAVTEIVSGVWDELRSSHTTSGTFGQGAASVQGNVTGSVASVTGAVGSVTGNVGGNVTGSVGSVTGAVGSVGSGGISSTSFAAGAIDATAFAQGAADKVWSTATRSLTTFGTLASDTATAVWAAGTRTLTSLSGNAANIASAVWDALTASYNAANSFGHYVQGISGGGGGSAPTAAEVADAVWDELHAAHVLPGSFGLYLDTQVSLVGGGGGGGSQVVPFTTSPAVDGVEVWITTSNNPAAGRVAQCTTGSDGTCSVNLDPGTYYWWSQHGGYSRGNGTMTVS